MAKAVKLNKDLLTSFSRDKQVSTALVADFQSIFFCIYISTYANTHQTHTYQRLRNSTDDTDASTRNLIVNQMLSHLALMFSTLMKVLCKALYNTTVRLCIQAATDIYLQAMRLLHC